MLFGINWFGLRAEYLAELIEKGQGPSAPRRTAALLRELRDTFETLESDVESLLAQLLSIWSGETSDTAAQVLRRLSTQLRDIAAVSDTVSQQADTQADANESARSSMPKLQEILEVLAALAAARASQNYGLVAALMALYRILSSRASSTMQGYEAATVPNLEQPPLQQASSTPSPGSGMSDVGQLLGSFPPEQPSTSTDPLGDQSTSSTLQALNGGGFMGGGGAFGDPLKNMASLTLGTALPGLATGISMLSSWPATNTPGLANSGVPATSSGAGVPPGVMGQGARGRRDPQKDREVARVDGAVIAPEAGDVPDIDGLGVFDVADADEAVSLDERPA